MTIYSKENLSPIIDNIHLTTFSNANIKFVATSFTPNLEQTKREGTILESCKTFYCIEAIINNEKAGYILLSNLSDTIKKAFLDTPLDWYIHKYCSNHIKNNWLQGIEKDKCLTDIKNMLNISMDYDVKAINDYLANTSYGLNYISFINYWHNKGNVEYICVYSNEDKNYKSFENFPFEHHEREVRTHYKGQGIGQALYLVGSSLLDKLNLHIYESNTQTEEGKKVFGKLTKHPKFNVISESILSITTQNRKELVSIDRRKLILK